MHIRPLAPADRKELVKLIVDFENSSQSSLSQLQASMRAYIDIQKIADKKIEKYLSNSNYIVFVADEDGILRGYISGEIQEKKYRVYKKAGYVENWYIQKNYQDHGIGKELFEALTHEFKKADCTHLALDTNIENIRAIEIYEHMGFKKRQVTFFKFLKDLS